MMDESDDDFKELCATFLQRVKKNVTKEVSGERKTQKTSSSTQISKPRRTKPPATKDKALQGPREKTRSGSQAPRTKKQGAPKWQRSEPTPPENGEGSVLASAALREGVQSTQTEASLDSSSQPAPSCLTVMAPSPSKPRTAELVLQRMQQFKRADPERLLRASEERCLEAALEEDAPAGPPEEMTAGNGSGPRLPATESDAAVALALQQEFGEQRASAQEAELEEKGLFFCQICQKNLSAMNVTRREQHVNRCLDEAEKALTPSTPRIPECPICGKPFLSPKSRMSHLKQCAAKMGVGPQLLLQAVRLQTAEPDEACGTPASSFSSHVGGLKRKGAPKRKEPRKKRKVDEPEAPSEDLLVAMALSRSETERDAVPSVLRLESAFSERIRLGAEKKSRKRKAPVCAPPLLVQDLETRGRQTEDRVARLFAEETELSSTPPLPASRILKEAREGAGRRLQPPGGKQNFLWEGSALTGAWVLEDFYTASLVPPVVPQRPAKGCSPEPTLLPVPPDQPEPGVRTPPALPSAPPVGRGARNPSPSASQREHQALQDLVDLAREGLSATPWPCSRGPARSGGAAGLDMSPTGLPPTGFVLPPEEKPLDRGSHASLTLALLLADLRAMVDNPQLSDVQLQTDRGDVLYAHKFVLYARCPLLMQYVNSEGFSVVEDGDPRSQRVLLSDVSTEATRALLHYLYTADPGVPPRLAPDLSALAHRFGVSELVLLCEQAPDASDPDGPRKQEEDEDCESRAENFQELLRSMWVEEEEEAEALLKSESLEEDREKVNEAEMEEIYEFAATQRKLLRGEGAPEIKEETDQCGDSGPVSAQILASGQVNEQSENAEQMESSGQKRGEAPARQRSMRQSTPPPLWGPCADEEKAGAPEEARGRSGSPPPAGGRREGRKEGVFWCSADAPEARPRSSTPRRCRGLAQIVSHLQEAKGTVLGPRAGSPCAPAPWQTPPWSPCLSQAPGGQSPGQSHPRSCLRGESPPPGPQPQGRASGVASRDSPAKRRRSRSLLTLLQDPGLQKGEERGSSLECRNKGILTSPEKSPSIDLTLSKPGRLSSRPQNTPPSKNRGDEIILLLDSDEELELEQSKIKSGFNTALEERKVLEVSPKSSELFSVIDIDADQEIFQSPARKEASLQGGEERPAGNRGSVGGRGTPRLSCDPESSPEEDSTTDTSWLVPATPLASRSRDSSSQTQVTGLRSRASVDHTAQVKAWTPLENRGGPEAARKSSVITPQMSSSCLVPTRAGSPDSQSPSRRPHPRRHQHGSPAPCPISVGLDDLTRQSQKHCPPGPSLLSQAIASEVVEVEDSEDEQEAASCRANSSSLLDGDPPIPVDDCHWHVEPLSPIPIDRLNLERTGPLSPGSPGRKAGEAPGSRGCLSPALLATAPARGSCAGQRKSQEKSPRAGSPGSSRPSSLNSALCDDWDGEDQKSPEPLPRAQTASAAAAQNSEALETPKGANRKNLPPKVPITPMPRYSIMETPVLKKELDRFGVRPLPKRQMVLKLKEIFQYTHQTLESDSENESRSSQGPPQAPHSQTHASRTSKAPRAAGRARLEATSGPLPQRSKGSTKTKGPRHQKKQPGGSIPPMSTSPAREGHPDPDGDAQLPASQESVASSADSSDSSFSSLSSSSCEFGAAFESAEDAEGEEEGSAAQAAAPAAATEAALRHYIRSRPALYRRVLLYQPFELAELQAELKQHGLRVATQRLLDFLDAHCITFTTAAARKERLGRKRRQPVARRGAEPPGRSVPPHRRPAAAREAPQPPAASQASPALSGSGDRILPP